MRGMDVSNAVLVYAGVAVLVSVIGAIRLYFWWKAREEEKKRRRL